MKTIAWNVDTLDDFMSSSGKLYVKGAETIVPVLEIITPYFRSMDIPIVSLADQHDKDSAEISATPDFVSTFCEHSMRGTPGAEFIAATRPINPYIVDWKDASLDTELLKASKEIVIYKDKFDAFQGNPHTDAIVKALAPDRAYVYGVATDFCVDYAVTGLVNRGIQVYVIEDAIKELIAKEPTLEKWKNLGVKLIKAEDLYSR